MNPAPTPTPPALVIQLTPNADGRYVYRLIGGAWSMAGTAPTVEAAVSGAQSELRERAQ